MLTSATLGGTKKYVLMGFKVLLLITIPETLERRPNRTSKGLRNRLMRAPALLDSSEGGGFFLEELAGKWIQLGGGEVTL